jgi:inner membrane protein
MPTAFSHPAVAWACRLAGGGQRVPGRLLALAALCSVLPDVDAVGYWLGIPYGHWLGHRGLTHSLPFALALGWVASSWAARLRASRLAAFLTVTLATGSHGLLDALTSGGLGVALLAPLSNQRFFFPWRPILVSPISIVGFFESRSLLVLASELLWVWLPALGLGALVGLWRRATSAA